MMMLVAAMLAIGAGAAEITLKWDAPAANADGSPLNGMAGYIVCYGTAPGTYQSSLDVGLETRAVIGGLQTGVTYYFAVRAYNEWNQAGTLSPEVQGSVPGKRTRSTLIILI